MGTYRLIILVIAAGILGFLLSGNRTGSVKTPVQNTTIVSGSNSPAGSDAKFAYLAEQTSNGCGLQRQTVFNYSDTQRIQGSCCSRMDIHVYKEQIEGLKKYKDISFIPKDPYDISAQQAKVAYGFLENIKLTDKEQQVYSEAMKLSKEGGPCCCKCWHWDTYEGLAKKLIVSYNWSAEQVADLWDLSSACGGAGHRHG